MSDYFHHVPGRLRIKIPSIKQNPHNARTVESLFKYSPGIIKTRVSHVTGSLVLAYDPDVVDATDLITILRENAYLREETFRLTSRSGKGAVFTHMTRVVGKAAFSWAVGKALKANGLGVLAAFV